MRVSLIPASSREFIAAYTEKWANVIKVLWRQSLLIRAAN